MNAAALSPARHTQRRIEGAFYGFGAVFVLLGMRVLYLQALPVAAGRGDAKFEHRDVLPARRGQILATDGTAMAVTMDEYTITANPRGWTEAQKAQAAAKLAATIGGQEASYLASLSKINRSDGTKNYFVKLASHVSEEKVALLRAVMGQQKNETRVQRKARKDFWAPLNLLASPLRHYPMGVFAPQLIGFTDNHGKGIEGMEKAFEKQLGGTAGLRESLLDPRGRAIPGTVNTWKVPVDGQTLVTTIDPKIQAATDATLASTFAKYHPNFCVAVVMKPATGEIVAVSTAPQFDLNNRPKSIVDIASNRAFQYAYEPGSTWKIVTACAAVENIPDWQSKKFYIDGTASVGKHTIHDWQFWSHHIKPDTKGLSEGIRDSSNVTMYRFAQLMPRHILPDYAAKFGIGQRPDIDGFHLHPGYLPKRNPKEWSEAQYANFSFGQGMMITPLQLARIGSVIANGGLMMKPILIKEVRDARGKVLSVNTPKVERRVVAKATTVEVTKMLRRVVAEGTARKYIFIPGYAAVGKTGSAQKADGPRGYAAGKFISSFVGFLPMEKPEYVIAVMADEPHGSHWGSEVCGPAFTTVAQAAMVQMRLAMGTSAPAPNLALMERPKAPEKS